MESKDDILKFDDPINKELESLSPKKQKVTMKKDDYKYKECKVINYDNCAKTLDVIFDQFGIRIFNVENFNGCTAIVKYKGEIGKPNFEYKL